MEKDEYHDEDDISNFSEEDVSCFQSKLTNSAFLHGQMIHEERNETITSMYSYLSTSKESVLDGVKIDQDVNRMSFICIYQYNFYYHNFGFRPTIRPQSRGVRGIGGN